jgi:hypothetical protein
VELWTEVGEQIDPDLQKANLRTDASTRSSA